MKTDRVAQAKQAVGPAAAHDTTGGSVQRKAATSPRQAGEAAHIAQLKGETKGKGKAPPPAKGKRK